MKTVFSLIIFLLLQAGTSFSVRADADRTQLLNKYVFDVDFYLARNPDLAAVFNGDKNAATEHWVNSGFYEFRRGSIYFSVGNYACYNPGLATAFGTFSELYLNHFLSSGINEGRISSFLYDGKSYLSFNSDLQAALGNNYHAALDHYVVSGINEGRRASRWFSVLEYLGANPDLQSVLGNNYPAALMHYAQFGVKEGRSLGNVEPKVSTCPGVFNNSMMTGNWRSPQLPGYRFAVTQNGYAIKVCQEGYSCGSGVSGTMDLKHNVVLIGRLAFYAPQQQWTAKFDSPSHGILRVDYCNPVYTGYGCSVKAGDSFEVIKE